MLSWPFVNLCPCYKPKQTRSYTLSNTDNAQIIVCLINAEARCTLFESSCTQMDSWWCWAQGSLTPSSQWTPRKCYSRATCLRCRATRSGTRACSTPGRCWLGAARLVLLSLWLQNNVPQFMQQAEGAFPRHNVSGFSEPSTLRIVLHWSRRPSVESFIRVVNPPQSPLLGPSTFRTMLHPILYGLLW